MAGSPEEPIMAREPEFKILKNADGRYYWHLEAANYQLVAWSGQNYASKQSCADELYWIKDNASLIMIYDCTGE
jgi:uncharacterized protein YegP (UPF0339 family)